MSAALSEKSSKSKKGRPSLLSETEEAMFKAHGLLDSKFSRRSVHNVHYRQRALASLIFKNKKKAEIRSFQWLADGEKMKRGEPGAWRQTILVELGRIEDVEVMRAVALRLCELKPKTKDAVLMVRNYRNGGKPKADALQLANEIIRAVNDYLQRHSDMSREQILNALHTATVQIKEAQL